MQKMWFQISESTSGKSICHLKSSGHPLDSSKEIFFKTDIRITLSKLLRYQAGADFSKI